jgi:hypothetical protein
MRRFAAVNSASSVFSAAVRRCSAPSDLRISEGCANHEVEVDVAVKELIVAHRSSLEAKNSSLQKQLMHQAWSYANKVESQSHVKLEDAIMLVSLVAYFSNYWGNGILGPSEEQIAGIGNSLPVLNQSSSTKLSRFRRTSVQASSSISNHSPLPRKSPLDEVFE